MDIRDFIIGGISGALSRTVTAPIELAKIQSQNKYMPNSNFRSVINGEGIIGLWKGNFTNCIRIMPQNAINFTIYEYMANNDRLLNISSNKTLTNFYSGSIAGMIAMTITYPLENARSRLCLQSNKNHYKNLLDVFKKTPITHLYRGLRMSIIGFTPYNAINFTMYNEYKKFTNNIIISGGLAGMTALSITYPTDLIRRRLQLQGFTKDVPKYDGIIDCVRKIIKNDGILGLYRGLLFGYMKCVPAVAIQFWFFEIMKETINY
jgi:solute carrier family 25 (mitochondrial phosphate transporter), member 23/24/25/41